MKCWFGEQDARVTSGACGGMLCHGHAYLHDEMTLAKSDASARYTSCYNVYGALKCSGRGLARRNLRPDR